MNSTTRCRYFPDICFDISGFAMYWKVETPFKERLTLTNVRIGEPSGFYNHSVNDEVKCSTFDFLALIKILCMKDCRKYDLGHVPIKDCVLPALVG
jgi:hypothetical protein